MASRRIFIRLSSSARHLTDMRFTFRREAVLMLVLLLVPVLIGLVFTIVLPALVRLF